VKLRPLLILALALAGLAAGCQAPPARLEAERREACAIAADAGRRLLAIEQATFDPVLDAPAFAIGAAVSAAPGIEAQLAVQGLRLKALGERHELARHLDCSAEFARRGLPISPDTATLTRQARLGPVRSVRFGRPVRMGDWAILEQRRLLCRPAGRGGLPISVQRPIGPVRLARMTAGGWADMGGAAPGPVRDRLARTCAWAAAY
jgi:hypothetical protein